MIKNTLYLASQSQTRQKLLTIAQIPYHIIEHYSTECGIDATGSFNDYVLAIAKHKMKNVKLPDPTTLPTDTIFILTADTLLQTAHTKQILGKPETKDDAKRMHALLCEQPAHLATACCLDLLNMTLGSLMLLSNFVFHRL